MAIRYFRLAANQDHAAARYFLGACYMYGWGVDRDRAIATGLMGQAER
jgi:TPR repeat protein